MAESTTKLLLIPALDEVFRRRGYEGATLSELARACSLGKASLYHHFPGGKDEMASLLLRRAVAELNEFAYRQLDRPAPWRERLCAFVDGFSHYCAGGTRNCLIAQFAATAARNRFGDEIQLQTERWMHQLTAAFSEIDAHEKRARRRARELLATLYGSLVVARLLNDPAPFELTIQRLRKGFAEESRSR